jgi:CubicO group peptidase (beta-lactamase class C family)
MAAVALAAAPGLAGIGLATAETESSRGFRGPAEMEQFIDGVMAGQRESREIVGAVVVVVSDGDIYFSKGYGHADLQRQLPVDPNTTLFRIGSVTKLFTASAVMQLWEQNKLRLDEDVNHYLRAFQVPATLPEPITLAHLLTHTAGFEDRSIGLFSHHPTAVQPLVITLADELPARVRPPGRISVYSNHGMALAGLLVQEVSGMLWEEFVQTNILQPLGMEHTTDWQPVRPELEPHLAVGYRHRDGQFQAADFEFVPIAPAGGASASGADMARFMIAHLQPGRGNEQQLLSPETVRLMHRRLFSNAAGINGMLHGFCEMNQNGERIIGHGGALTCFHTLLALMPERGVGVFISLNSDTGAGVHEDFWQAFLNHYFPATNAAPPRLPADSKLRWRAYAGEYSGLRRSFTTLTKLSAILWTARVTVDPAGYLVTTGLSDKPQRWIEVEPSLFQESEGTRRIAFRTEIDGRTTYLFPNFPAMAFIRHHWYESSTFHFALAGGALLLLASALVFWPALAWYLHGRPIIGSPPRTARFSAWLMCLLLTAFFAGVTAVVADPHQIGFGVSVFLQRLLWLPLVAALFLAISGLFVLRAWFKGYWSLPGRVYYTLVALAGITVLWWTWHWNLLGFHY